MRALAMILALSFIALFAYQLAIYPTLPVADGDAYGIGDVIELYATLACFAFAALSISAAGIAVVLKKTSVQRAAIVLATAIVCVVISRFVR